MNFKINYDSPKKIIRELDVVPIPYITVNNTKWSLHNLNVTMFNDGSEIPLVTDPKVWSTITTPARCYYDNDRSNGVLYNWYAVATGKLAPIGWHVATDEEWSTIDTPDKIYKLQLKQQLGGYRYYNGGFYYQSYFGLWWSATESDASYAYFRSLIYYNERLLSYYDSKKYGFSVRVVRDKELCI